MQSDYRVEGIYTNEETGEVIANCYDILYGEDFEKYLGYPDEFDGKENASMLLQDSTYEMTDEVRAEIESTFGVAEFNDENNYDDYQFYDFGDDEYEDDFKDEREPALVGETFNLREALNMIDLNTDNKYDLLNLYEACNLKENEKRVLANLVYDKNDPSVIYDTLNDRFLGKEIDMHERVKDGVIHEGIYSNDEESTMTLVANDVVKFPNVISFKATFDDGELKGHTWSFVKADANGEEFIRSIGGDPDDTPVAFLTVDGKDGGYFTSTKDFASGEYKSSKDGVIHESEDGECTYTAFAYEDDGITTYDLSTYDDKDEAITFAKHRNWDEVVNDCTGEVVWKRTLEDGLKEDFSSDKQDLYKEAMRAYDEDDMDFFYNLSDDELVTLSVSCKITDDNPFGAAYDDEVYDAIADRPNAEELFNKADEIVINKMPRYNLEKVYKRYHNEEGKELSDKDMRAKILQAIKDYKSTNESMKESIDDEELYCIVAITNDGKRKFYKDGKFIDDYKEATTWDDIDEARSEWYDIDKSRYKRVFVPNYTPDTFANMSESKSIKESDEETPYTKEEIERDLKSITHNFTDKDGELKCGFEEEKNFGVEILKQHYKVVETSGDDRRDGTWYHISFAEPLNKNESVNPSELDDCPECGDKSFDTKKGKCTKCNYQE